MDEVEERLRKLDATQNSILEASELLLKVQSKEPSLVPFIVSLWSRMLMRSHRSKKVAYVYLANDVLQKCNSMLLQGNTQAKHFMGSFE
jgi:hypothetical protein